MSAGLAGALFAFLKGSVFPDTMGVSTSIDGLVMVLLGGVETVSGPIVGAVVYKPLSIWLISHTDYSKLVLGLVIIALVLLSFQGRRRLDSLAGRAARGAGEGARRERASRSSRPRQVLWRRQGRARTFRSASRRARSSR